MENDKLKDEALDEVAGGGLFGDCPKSHNTFLCEALCSHVRKEDQTPTKDELTVSCDLGYWKYVCKYGEGGFI
jgi:hypothetical protein